MGFLPIFLMTGSFLGAPSPSPTVEDFLGSIGVNSAISQRGESLEKTAQCAAYLGIAWFRTDGGVPTEDMLALHERTGAKFSLCPGSGGSDLDKLLTVGRRLKAAGALLAFEGPNEPNNWPITYKGQVGGGSQSWRAVARFQSDLYSAVNLDFALRGTPVWSVSEPGAEIDDVGLQRLKPPQRTADQGQTPSGYADFANVHNYIYHPNAPGVADNKTWDAADPSPACRVDGLYGEYGVTWAHHYPGYSTDELKTLPRVTTETGCAIDGPITEHIQALNLLSLYLDQFARGWSYTAVYLLRDRVDEAGNQSFGFYRPDYSPRESALYLHNLTTILRSPAPKGPRTAIRIDVSAAPETVHHLLLMKGPSRQELIVWDEKLSGSDAVTVMLSKKSAVVVFDPTVGTVPIQRLFNTESVPLTLSDHPLVLDIVEQVPGNR